MIKLVVCDIDGTLLEKGASVLSEETADALGALVSAGKKVALASGRSYYSMRRVTEHLPFADALYYICDDGAICVYSGKTLYHKPLSIENLLKFDRNPAYSGCPSISSFVNVLNESIFTFLFCILWFARMLFKRSSMFNPSTKVRSRFVIIMTTFGASRPVFSIISDSL